MTGVQLGLNFFGKVFCQHCDRRSASILFLTKICLILFTLFTLSGAVCKAIVHAYPEIYKVQIPKDFYKSLNGLQHICQISVSKQSGHSGNTNDMYYRARSKKYSFSMIDIVIYNALTYLSILNFDQIKKTSWLFANYYSLKPLPPWDTICLQNNPF